MPLNPSKTPLLFSMVPHLAYEVAKEFYGDIHYVWCTTSFHDVNQPGMSDPQELGRTYLRDVLRRDRGSFIIPAKAAGILRGATAKRAAGVIDDSDYDKIKEKIAEATFSDYFPVLYVILASKVKKHCKDAPATAKGSSTSIEYIIDELKADEFQIVDFYSMMNDLVDARKEKVPH